MVIVITSLRLRHWWGFFRLSYNGLQIVRQTKTQPGFIEMKNTGFGYLHFTMSAWETETDAKEFARTGAHLDAMKQGPGLATEVGIYTYTADALPDWEKAKQLVLQHGRVIKY